jgi:hypothetical protein
MHRKIVIPVLDCSVDLRIRNPAGLLDNPMCDDEPYAEAAEVEQAVPAVMGADT